MLKIPRPPFYRLVLLAAIFLIAGCSPAPKYHGHPSRSPAPAEKQTAGRRKPVAAPVLLAPPVKNFNKSRITSYFGIRQDPRYKTSEFHSGIDIKAARGEDVLASASGTVAFAGRQSGYGKVVIIDHGDRFFTVYAHLESIYASKRATVSRGELIGSVGNSGRTTGIHLHFEVRKAGKAVNPIDYF